MGSKDNLLICYSRIIDVIVIRNVFKEFSVNVTVRASDVRPVNPLHVLTHDITSMVPALPCGTRVTLAMVSFNRLILIVIFIIVPSLLAILAQQFGQVVQ